MELHPFVADTPQSLIYDLEDRLLRLPITGQRPLRFALRLHHATRLHFDLRVEVMDTLFSLTFCDVPSLDPARVVRARMMPNHDPRYIGSERLIAAGSPGAGPTMPVELCGATPVVRTYRNYQLEMLDQLSRGKAEFNLDGERLNGAWQLLRVSDEFWDFRKLDDEFASKTEVLVLDTSILSGRSLGEIRAGVKVNYREAKVQPPLF